MKFGIWFSIAVLVGWLVFGFYDWFIAIGLIMVYGYYSIKYWLIEESEKFHKDPKIKDYCIKTNREFLGGSNPKWNEDWKERLAARAFEIESQNKKTIRQSMTQEEIESQYMPKELKKHLGFR